MDSEQNFLYIKTIVTLIMGFAGIVGNIVSFIVFSRKTFRKNSISIYCRALAIFDMYIVLSIITDFYNILYNYYIANYSDTVCVAMSYAYHAIGPIPGWILVAFSIDRTLSLKRVTNAMKRPILHYMIIFGIVLFNLLLYIEVPIFLRLFPLQIYGMTFYVCDPSTLSFGSVLNIVYIIEGSGLPFLIMIISSLITIKSLKDSRRQVEMIGSAEEKRKSRDRKFAITSITFNVLFIVLKMPFLVCVAIGYNFVSSYLFYIALALYFLNYSISFLVHFATNSLFRRELFILLRIRKPVADSTVLPNPSNTKNSHLNRSTVK